MPAPSAARQVDRSTVSAIIPCLDEETAIGPCVAAVLAHGLGEVIVVDGGSTDFTVERASQAGGDRSFTLRSGLPSAMVRLTGRDGAPVATLTGPKGEKISTAILSEVQPQNFNFIPRPEPYQHPSRLSKRQSRRCTQKAD